MKLMEYNQKILKITYFYSIIKFNISSSTDVIDILECNRA